MQQLRQYMACRRFLGENMDPFKENIVEHYKHPQNSYEMEKASAQYHDSNPVCGDDITFWLKISDEGIIKEASFKGTGCAISQASASMLTEEIVGKSLDEVDAITQDDIRELVGVPLTPVRLKCAILPMKIVQAAVLKYRGDHMNE